MTQIVANTLHKIINEEATQKERTTLKVNMKYTRENLSIA
jgi:hypothetical protein